MKVEDLKEGMILESRTIYNDVVYRKIVKITETYISYYRMSPQAFHGKDLYEVLAENLEKFFERPVKVIDKIPPKKIEVIEGPEIDLYIAAHLVPLLENKFSVHTTIFTEKNEDTVKIGSLQKKVIKELNFNWENLDWEE